jgi:hypothetical protein
MWVDMVGWGFGCTLGEWLECPILFESKVFSSVITLKWEDREDMLEPVAGACR